MAFANLALNKENKEAYLQEKSTFINLLQERANIFIEEAKEVGLPIYPYHEGFFLTIRIDDHVVKNELHLKLKKHNIFFVNVYGGLRVAICSIPKSKLKGLAKKIKDVLDTIDPDDENLESLQEIDEEQSNSNDTPATPSN